MPLVDDENETLDIYEIVIMALTRYLQANQLMMEIAISRSVKKLGEIMRLAFSKARSRIYTRRKTRRKEKNEDRTRCYEPSGARPGIRTTRQRRTRNGYLQ